MARILDKARRHPRVRCGAGPVRRTAYRTQEIRKIATENSLFNRRQFHGRVESDHGLIPGEPANDGLVIFWWRTRGRAFVESEVSPGETAGKCFSRTRTFSWRRCCPPLSGYLSALRFGRMQLAYAGEAGALVGCACGKVIGAA